MRSQKIDFHQSVFMSLTTIRIQTVEWWKYSRNTNKLYICILFVPDEYLLHLNSAKNKNNIQQFSMSLYLRKQNKLICSSVDSLKMALFFFLFGACTSVVLLWFYFLCSVCLLCMMFIHVIGLVRVQKVY